MYDLHVKLNYNRKPHIPRNTPVREVRPSEMWNTSAACPNHSGLRHQTLRNARQALCPPKPKELDTHRVTSACTARLGT